MFKNAKRGDEMALLNLADISGQDRWSFERQSRHRARAVYLGDKTAICRVMGRYKLYVSTDDVGFGSHMLLDGVWEPWVTTFMARFVKPGMWVADVGANHGYFTLLLADIVGAQGRVAAFEPHPTTVRHLRRSVSVNGFDDRVQIIERAVSDEDDLILGFHIPTQEPKNARLVDQKGGADVVEVKSTTLTTSFADWSRLDFIKIDIEGAEEAALRGAKGLIERLKPNLLLEFNSLRCKDPRELLRWLSKHYGDPLVLDFDSNLSPVGEDVLLDRGQSEDWMLFYQA